MTEHAWKIPVRIEMVLCGPWQDMNITVRAAELQAEPDTRPESPDAGEDPEPIDDLGLCCEAKLDVKQYADEAWRIADQLIKDKE